MLILNKICATYRHSFYSGVNPNDIAVLILASPLTFDETVNPIALPVPDSIPTGTAILSGWGATNAAASALPNQLQFVHKPIISFTGELAPNIFITCLLKLCTELKRLLLQNVLMP